jgi:hypothetical protein
MLYTMGLMLPRIMTSMQVTSGGIIARSAGSVNGRDFMLFKNFVQFYSISILTQLESLATEQPTPRASQELAKGVFGDACSFAKDLRKVQIIVNI